MIFDDNTIYNCIDEVTREVVDRVADLHCEWTEDDEDIQEDKNSGGRVLLQMLAGQDLKFQQHICGQGNPQKEARVARQREGTFVVPQLVYEIRIHQQLSHPNVVHLDHWF